MFLTNRRQASSREASRSAHMLRKSVPGLSSSESGALGQPLFPLQQPLNRHLIVHGFAVPARDGGFGRDVDALPGVFADKRKSVPAGTCWLGFGQDVAAGGGGCS